MTTPLPAGFRVELDQGTRQLASGVWFGGSPARVVKLTTAGQAAMGELRSGPVASRAAGLLARRLTDSGLAHPLPPDPVTTRDVTVVIPALGRAHLLDRCLAGLADHHPVVVVDDGSPDPATIAEIASRHGAKLIRHDVTAGPAAARNTAIEAIGTGLIAFVDSDCVPPSDWIDRLAGHFADPLVAAVAPRITGLAPPRTWCGRYATATSSLDLGGKPARVMPGAAVSYVPTAALLCRRTALAAIARDGQAFDAALRVGEDVDLVWRLHEAGWRVRYDPAVQVAHHEPATWPALLARRYRYGTSAAPLALRHPDAVTHLVLHPWPAATVAALLARRPIAAAAAFGACVLTTDATLRRADVPRYGLVAAMLTATRSTWLGAGRYGTQFAAPLLAALVAAPNGKARRLGRRVAAASLLLGPALNDWVASPRTLDPARFALGRIADDVAYGFGVWSGCLTERTIAPVRPEIAWHHLRQGWHEK